MDIEKDDRLVIVAGWWIDPSPENSGGPRAQTGGMTSDPDEIDKLFDRAFRYVDRYKCGSVKIVPFSELTPAFFKAFREEIFEQYKEEYKDELVGDVFYPRDHTGDVREVGFDDTLLGELPI